MIYLVKLTEGNSSGNYNIYYDSITPGNSNLMTLVSTNTLATNLTLEQLLQGVEVSSPVVPNKVIVYGIECDVALNLTFTKSSPVTIPPIYCITYLSDTQKTLQLLPQTSLYNGEIQWITTDGTKNLRWNPYYNGGRGRWEMSVDSNLILVNETKTNGLPSGSWFFIGSIIGSSVDTLNKTLVVSEGICTPTQTFSCSLKSTPNSCSGSKTYDGTITVTVLGGTPPYTYDNGILQSTWPVFNSVAPGDYIIVTRDSEGNETSCSTTVGDGDKKIDYTVTMGYITNDVFTNFDTKTKRTSFDLTVQPAIPAGTTISVTLTFTDIRRVSSPGTGTVSNIIEISKNGEVVPISTVIQRQINAPRDNCSNYNYVETIISKEVTFTLTSGDVLEGFITSTVNLTSPQVDNTSNCATELKNDFNINKFILTTNCKCCTVTSANSTPLKLMDNVITATVKSNPGAIPIQLAYSQADCDTACKAAITTYYTPCFTLAPNCELFTDTTLTAKPPAGYYSDYTYCHYFNGDVIVDTRLCSFEPPPPTIKYYKADVFRCSPFNCTIPIDNIIVSVDPNYTLIANAYYRDVEYSDFVYEITQTRNVTGPATRNLDPNTQSFDCQACCSITPP